LKAENEDGKRKSSEAKQETKKQKAEQVAVTQASESKSETEN
jgi:hypothetical protein